MKAKVIINLPDCKIEKYQAQQREAYETWIPVLREKGIEVIKSVSNLEIEGEYKLEGEDLLCNCTDDLDRNFILKRFYFIKWALENRDFDYLFITSFDTFVHPDRFPMLLDSYLEKPEIEASGAVWPRMGWWPWGRNLIQIDQSKYDANLSLSGGSGFVLSRRACEVLRDNYPTFNADGFKDYEDDAIFSKVLKDNGVYLWHDEAIITGSPQQMYWTDPHNVGVPRIDLIGGEFLAAQSPLDGNMREVFANYKHTAHMHAVLAKYMNKREGYVY